MTLVTVMLNERVPNSVQTCIRIMHIFQPVSIIINNINIERTHKFLFVSTAFLNMVSISTRSVIFLFSRIPGF